MTASLEGYTHQTHSKIKLKISLEKLSGLYNLATVRSFVLSYGLCHNNFVL